ncbi:unnamed protein product, partial [Brassica oleracea]
MNELREVSYQYTSVADPTESAARRQRVLRSEEEGLMEATAAGIIEAATRNVEALRMDTPLPMDLQSNTQPENNAHEVCVLHDQVTSTPVTSRRQQNRMGTSRRTSTSPRFFSGTNLRRRNIPMTCNNASKHGFPHVSPIQTTQRRRGTPSGLRQTRPPAPAGTSSGGGLALLWKSDVDLQVLTSTPNFIDTSVSFKGVSFFSTSVYGAPEIQHRQ